ncbi:MAG: phosphodiester glycosidase family protein [Patescibacteria group bacterium]|nr:phosphodiester glycosidase family protein [Patescibacteria group bacterium]
MRDQPSLSAGADASPLWPCQTLQPVEPEYHELFPGAVLRRYAADFPAHGLADAVRTNVFEAIFDDGTCRFGLRHSVKPKSPWDFLSSGESAVVMNAGFCFVADHSPMKPVNHSYHFQALGRRLMSLPTKTKTALVCRDGRFSPARVEARGRLRIGATEMVWVGSHEADGEAGEKAIVFGLANQTLRKDERGIAAMPDDGIIGCPRGCRQVLMRNGLDGNLVVAEITGASVPVLTATVILQVPEAMAGRLRVGDAVEDWVVGGFSARDFDAAVTTSVELGSNPDDLAAAVEAERVIMARHPDGSPFYRNLDSPKGRAAVFETQDGRVHFLIIDARPDDQNQKGVTLGQLARWLRRGGEPRWAVSVDGGQSAKIGWSVGGRRDVVGNLHYVNYDRPRPFWDGWRGRPVTSCVAAWPV